MSDLVHELRNNETKWRREMNKCVFYVNRNRWLSNATGNVMLSNAGTNEPLTHETRVVRLKKLRWFLKHGNSKRQMYLVEKCVSLMLFVMKKPDIIGIVEGET